MTRGKRLLALVGSLLCLFSCATGMDPVHLQFAPQETLNWDPPNVQRLNTSRSLWIRAITDARGLQDNSLIGVNREKTPIAVRAGNSVSSFALEALRTCLTAWGVRLSEDAELALIGEISQLTVVEQNRYNADINIRFRLEDRAGNVLWEGPAIGHASTWGHSLSPENYNQVLSDALRLTYANLVGNPTFQSALSGQNAQSTAPATSSGGLKNQILELMDKGVGTEVIVGYVRSQRLVAPLTADEILDWKKSGIPDAVVRAALREPDSKTP